MVNKTLLCNMPNCNITGKSKMQLFPVYFVNISEVKQPYWNVHIINMWLGYA